MKTNELHKSMLKTVYLQLKQHTYKHHGHFTIQIHHFHVTNWRKTESPPPSSLCLLLSQDAVLIKGQ